MRSEDVPNYLSSSLGKSNDALSQQVRALGQQRRAVDTIAHEQETPHPRVGCVEQRAVRMTVMKSFGGSMRAAMTTVNLSHGSCFDDERGVTPRSRSSSNPL